jgi:hypothetical protein
MLNLHFQLGSFSCAITVTDIYFHDFCSLTEEKNGIEMDDEDLKQILVSIQHFLFSRSKMNCLCFEQRANENMILSVYDIIRRGS